MGRVPAPQGCNHHHRPVILFKEQLTKIITALKNFKCQVLRSRPRLLRYKDSPRASAEICPAPKLRDTTSSRARLRRQLPANFDAARDESELDPDRPSSAADRSSW